MVNFNLSIIIPAYNEEKRLPNTLNQIKNYLKHKHFSYEIIVVNDGSKDQTQEIIQKQKGIKLISYIPNKGKGYAVKKGALSAQGELILFTDADLSTPIEELDHFLELSNNYDIIIGSRGLNESNVKVHQPLHREFMGKVFNKIVRILTIKGIKDTQCGFKLFKKQTTISIFESQLINGFGFDVELLYLAQKKGLKIKEEPVTWINSNDSRVNPLKDSLKMLKEILIIKTNYIRGRYGHY